MVSWKCQQNERRRAVTCQSILNWITILDRFSEQRSQGKSFVFSFKTMKCLEQLISVRSCVAMFTQTVGMTASDWPVSRVVKRSQTIKILLLCYLLLSFTEIAVSGLILRPKAMKLCSDTDFKASLGWEDRLKHVGTQTLSMDHMTTPSMTTKCLK